MGFNYGFEKKKFEKEWKKLREEYSNSGMSEEDIQKMYEYDLRVFNRKRADAKHEQPFTGKMCSDSEEYDESKSALFEKFANELSYEDSYLYNKGKFAWIETIENKELYKKISSLSDSDKELLTLLVIAGFNISEIARIQNKAISTISEKIARIKKHFHQNPKK